MCIRNKIRTVETDKKNPSKRSKMFYSPTTNVFVISLLLMVVWQSRARIKFEPDRTDMGYSLLATNTYCDQSPMKDFTTRSCLECLTFCAQIKKCMFAVCLAHEPDSNLLRCRLHKLRGTRSRAPKPGARIYGLKYGE